MASNLRSDENIKMATIPSFIKYGSQDSNAASILQKIFSITENMPGTFIKLKKKIPKHSANTLPKCSLKVLECLAFIRAA